MSAQLTRRALLGRAAAGAGSLALGGALVRATGVARAAGSLPLPSPAQVRADFQRMVDFGPRLCGSDAHNRYIDWLKGEFVAAGCDLEPCDVYETSRWMAQGFGLEILAGSGSGPVKVASYFPRSQQTPPGGVTGPLVYGGTLPELSLNGSDVAALEAAIARYPADVASWAAGVSGAAGGDPRGSVLVVDLPMPPPLTGGLFTPMVTYYSGQGETEADLATVDYKRLWTVPGLALPLDSFTAMGVAGVVLIVDASYEALVGQYAPFEWANEGVPALYVDRDTGDRLRAQAASRPAARLTLTATRTTVPSEAVTAVLPGASSEALIFNTHTDGTGFVEENGAVAFVHLARYFGSLPPGRRLRRTLVFAAWPGHFSNDLPQTNGWIHAHQDIVNRAAAALTVEHLGCSEWNDSTDVGYHATGRSELFAVWATQGKMAQLTQSTVAAHNLPRTAVLRPPAQFGVGGPFQTAGVPQIGAIAGPEYLLTVSANGDMDKLDERLAARQIAWLADLATQLDPVPAADLRQGDPTLGGPAPQGNIEPSTAVDHPQACTPARPAGAAAPTTLLVRTRSGRTLVVRYYGRRHALRGVLVTVQSAGGSAGPVTVELRRGARLVARARTSAAGPAPARLVLRPVRGRSIARGAYTLVVRGAGRTLARRAVHVG